MPRFSQGVIVSFDDGDEEQNQTCLGRIEESQNNDVTTENVSLFSRNEFFLLLMNT